MPSEGGTVTVSYRSGEVQYQAAVPAGGYSVETKQTSPEVEVRFAAEDDTWVVKIRWHEGELDVDIDHQGDHDDD